MLKGLALCLLIATVAAAQDTTATERVNVVSQLADGKILHKGVGFLFDDHTLVCSYADVKDAFRIRIEWEDASAFTSRLIAFNESIDVALFQIGAGGPLPALLGSSKMLAKGDPVTFWVEQNGDWDQATGTVSEISDMGKGYDRITVASATLPSHSSPLYNSKQQIVGWINGKSATPLERIAQLAEKQNQTITPRRSKGSTAVWKFQKPPVPTNSDSPDMGDMIALQGPTSFPFRIDVPHAWKTSAYKPSTNFLLRIEDSHSGICAELRVTRLPDGDLLTGIDRTEALVFGNLLRSEMDPYSTDHFTGFRAAYEDSDAGNSYGVDVFYTAFSGNLYILSVAYPQNIQSEVAPLIEQIFSSLRN